MCCQAKDKERRERVRAIRIKEAQEEYEARLIRSMERAAAPVKKKTVGCHPATRVGLLYASASMVSFTDLF